MIEDGFEENVSHPSKKYPNIVYYIVLSTVCFDLLLELMCLIFFIFHFIKKTPIFNKKYFHFLFLGYFIAVITLTFAIFQCVWEESYFILFGNVMSEWYFEFILGPWNMVLAINRFTALLFWKKHSYIWSNRSFYVTLFLLLVYPLIATGFVVMENPECFLVMEKPECIHIFIKFDNIQMISNGLTVFISAILGIINVFVLRYKIINVIQSTKKMENHLLLQSLISSLFFGFYCLYATTIDVFYDKTEEQHVANSVLSSFLLALSNSYYLYFHLSATLLLFCLS